MASTSAHATPGARVEDEVDELPDDADGLMHNLDDSELEEEGEEAGLEEGDQSGAAEDEHALAQEQDPEQEEAPLEEGEDAEQQYEEGEDAQFEDEQSEEERDGQVEDEEEADDADLTHDQEYEHEEEAAAPSPAFRPSPLQVAASAPMPAVRRMASSGDLATPSSARGVPPAGSHSPSWAAFRESDGLLADPSQALVPLTPQSLAQHSGTTPSPAASRQASIDLSSGQGLSSSRRTAGGGAGASTLGTILSAPSTPSGSGSAGLDFQKQLLVAHAAAASASASGFGAEDLAVANRAPACNHKPERPHYVENQPSLHAYIEVQARSIEALLDQIAARGSTEQELQALAPGQLAALGPVAALLSERDARLRALEEALGHSERHTSDLAALVGQWEAQVHAMQQAQAEEIAQARLEATAAAEAAAAATAAKVAAAEARKRAGPSTLMQGTRSPRKGAEGTASGNTTPTRLSRAGSGTPGSSPLSLSLSARKHRVPPTPTDTATSPLPSEPLLPASSAVAERERLIATLTAENASFAAQIEALQQELEDMCDKHDSLARSMQLDAPHAHQAAAEAGVDVAAGALSAAPLPSPPCPSPVGASDSEKQLLAEAEALRREMDATQERNAAAVNLLQAQCTEALKCNAELQAELAQAHAIPAGTSLEELEKLRAAHAAELAASKAANASLRAEVAQQVRELEAADEALADAQAKLRRQNSPTHPSNQAAAREADLQRHLQQAQRDLQALQQSLDDAQARTRELAAQSAAESDKLRADNAALRGDLEAQEAALPALQHSLDDAVQHNASLQAQVLAADAVRTANESLRSEALAHERELHAAEETLCDAQEKLRQQTESSSSTQSATRELLAHNETLRRQLQEAHTQAEQQADEMQAKHGDLMRRHTELREELARTQARHADETASFGSQSAALADAEVRHAAERDELQGRLEAQQRELTDSLAQHALVLQRTAGLQTELEQAQASSAAEMERLRSAHASELADERAANDALRRGMEQQARNLQTSDEALTEAQEKLRKQDSPSHASNQAVQATKRELKAAQRELVQAQQALADAETKLLDRESTSAGDASSSAHVHELVLERELASVRQALVDALDRNALLHTQATEAEVLRQELAQMRGEHATLREGNEAQVERLQGALQTALEKLQGTDAQQLAADQALAASQQELAAAQAQVLALQQALAELQAQMDAALRELELLRAQLLAAQASLAEAQARLRRTESPSVQAALAEAQAKLRRAESPGNPQHQSAARELLASQQALLECQTKLARSEALVASLEEQVAKLRSRIGEQAAQLAETQGKVDALQAARSAASHAALLERMEDERRAREQAAARMAQDHLHAATPASPLRNGDRDAAALQALLAEAESVRALHAAEVAATRATKQNATLRAELEQQLRDLQAHDEALAEQRRLQQSADAREARMTELLAAQKALAEGHLTRLAPEEPLSTTRSPFESQAEQKSASAGSRTSPAPSTAPDAGAGGMTSSVDQLRAALQEQFLARAAMRRALEDQQRALSAAAAAASQATTPSRSRAPSVPSSVNMAQRMGLTGSDVPAAATVASGAHSFASSPARSRAGSIPASAAAQRDATMQAATAARALLQEFKSSPPPQARTAHSPSRFGAGAGAANDVSVARSLAAELSRSSSVVHTESHSRATGSPLGLPSRGSSTPNPHGALAQLQAAEQRIARLEAEMARERAKTLATLAGPDARPVPVLAADSESESEEQEERERKYAAAASVAPASAARTPPRARTAGAGSVAATSASASHSTQTPLHTLRIADPALSVSHRRSSPRAPLIARLTSVEEVTITRVRSTSRTR